jgi:hypothetical protein
MALLLQRDIIPGGAGPDGMVPGGIVTGGTAGAAGVKIHRASTM